MNYKHAIDNAQLENAFFELAYWMLQDKIKILLPYLVGFELVEVEDDGKRAIGVFAFKTPSGQVLYVPSFYKNGNVKNVDKLYSANNQQFYPLTDEYAQLFLKDTANTLGDPSDITPAELRSRAPATDYRYLSVPPRTGKYSRASDDSDKSPSTG